MDMAKSESWREAAWIKQFWPNLNPMSLNSRCRI